MSESSYIGKDTDIIINESSNIISYYIDLLSLNDSNNILNIHSMKKISKNGDYFVVLDDGLYIYNFEKSKREIIFYFNQTIFEDDDKNNHIIISNNETDNKIAVLINHHFFIYSYENSIKNIEYILIQNLIDNEHLTQPFNIEIDNFKLIIDLIKLDKNNKIAYGCSQNYIKSFIFENYTSIKSDIPKIIEFKLENSCEQSCQFDFYYSLIKCIKYPLMKTNFILLTLKRGDNNYEIISEEDVHDGLSLKRYGNYFNNATFSLTKEINLICYNNNITVVCYYKNNTNRKFTKINYYIY